MAKKIGVLLSGCGVFDGSEIHEATLTLYFLDKHGAEAVCMAPNRKQARVVDHVTGKPAGEERNVLAEAARIARGKITDVASVSAADLDGIVVPGGFGAALNLCGFAEQGPACEVDADVEKLLQQLHSQRKPIGALCIAPALIARLFGKCGAEVTIGTDRGTAAAIESMGARHREARPDEMVADEKNRIATTPCYMTARRISDVAAGVEQVVTKVLQWAGSPQ